MLLSKGVVTFCLILLILATLLLVYAEGLKRGCSWVVKDIRDFNRCMNMESKDETK